jgi:hypothetical protein
LILRAKPVAIATGSFLFSPPGLKIQRTHNGYSIFENALKGGWRCLEFARLTRRRNRAIPSAVLPDFGNEVRRAKNGNP